MCSRHREHTLCNTPSYAGNSRHSESVWDEKSETFVEKWEFCRRENTFRRERGGMEVLYSTKSKLSAEKQVFKETITLQGNSCSRKVISWWWWNDFFLFFLRSKIERKKKRCNLRVKWEEMERRLGPEGVSQMAMMHFDDIKSPCENKGSGGTVPQPPAGDTDLVHFQGN